MEAGAEAALPPASHLAALVAYDGTRFHGFQRQVAERGPTVQGALEAAISRVAGQMTSVDAAGRTDRGVHATGQVVSFASIVPREPLVWQRALNALLRADVVVRAVSATQGDFHARYSALARRYRYRVVVSPVRLPLRERYAWRVPWPLDVAAMRAAAESLLGEHDFAAFGSSPRDERGPAGRVTGHTVRAMRQVVCEERALVAEDGLPGQPVSEVIFSFAANAFLTGMVRRLVGTLVLVGAGHMTPAGFASILRERAKQHPGTPAPACGLCLVGADYPPGALNWQTEALKHASPRTGGDQGV